MISLEAIRRIPKDDLDKHVRNTMTQVNDDWLFVDIYGQVWLLVTTKRPDMPIEISPEIIGPF